MRTVFTPQALAKSVGKGVFKTCTLADWEKVNTTRPMPQRREPSSRRLGNSHHPRNGVMGLSMGLSMDTSRTRNY